MNIAVYCGSKTGNIREYQVIAKELGYWIGKKGHRLIYGGGHTGLMGVVSDAVLDAGGRVFGVVPHFLTTKEQPHLGATDLQYVNTMSERKDIMKNLGDAFIALPGGPGTLEEITEIISDARLGKANGPAILFNFEGFWEPVRAILDQMVRAEFIAAEEIKDVYFASSLKEIVKILETPETAVPKGAAAFLQQASELSGGPSHE